MHEARHRITGARRVVRSRVTAALAVGAAGLAVATWLPGRNAVASAAELPSAFADDFTAAAGAGLDYTKWTLCGRPDDAAQDGMGDLVVTGVLRTRAAFTQAYGHAEARVAVDRAPGVWRTIGVVDQDGRLIPGQLRIVPGGPDPTSGDDFHTYAIDWSPEQIVWSVDGEPAMRLITHTPTRGIVLVLNLATNGFMPGRMTVDFVHVSAGDRGEPGPSVSEPAESVSPSVEPSLSAEPSVSTSVSPSFSASTEPAMPSPTRRASSTRPSSAPSSTPPPATPSSRPSSTPSRSAPTTKPARTKKPAAKPSAWKPYKTYAVGDLVTFQDATYRVKEAHTSLPGWEPTALPALFQKV